MSSDTSPVTNLKKNAQSSSSSSPSSSSCLADKKDPVSAPTHDDHDNDNDNGTDNDNDNPTNTTRQESNPADPQATTRNHNTPPPHVEKQNALHSSSSPFFDSPEPFSHPSSPIQNNDSLTFENLHLLDHSLALTEHDGGGGVDLVPSFTAALSYSHNSDPNHNYDNDDNGNYDNDKDHHKMTTTNMMMMQSSYVSFPSSFGSRSRSNSIVSSAVLSASTAIANNTSHGGNKIPFTKRRRPRPWDDYHHPNVVTTTTATSSLSSLQSKKDAADWVEMEKKCVETTPLLPNKTSTIHSVTTAKRGNGSGMYGRKRIVEETMDGEEGGMVDVVRVQICNDASGRESPHLEWKEGVFIDHYGSIPRRQEDGYDDTPRLGRMAHSYGIKEWWWGGGAGAGAGAVHGGMIPLFFPILTFLTVLQFVLMAMYNLFLHYHSHRLNHQPPYAFWFSEAGRIYNPGIGPNVPTLILFGVFHPLLVMEKDGWWRMMSGLVCCTSLVEFGWNVFWLRVLMGMEEERSKKLLLFGSQSRKSGSGGGGGGRMLGCVFGVCGIMGALAHMIVGNGNDVVFVTGLNSAGIAGCMAAIGVMDHWRWKCKKSHVVVSSYYKENNNGQWWQSNRGMWWTGSAAHPSKFVYGCILCEIMFGLFLPYTSLASVVFGILMGIFCGMLLLNHQSDGTWDDVDSQGSSLGSDLEDAFHLNLNTPQRFNFGETPPPPPSSSSKGLDTPIMRRSILTSPDDDDEYDLVQSLNESGGKGLKQRNLRSAAKRQVREVVDNGMKEEEEDAPRRSMGYTCSEPRLRFVGLMGVLWMLSSSVVYIGWALSMPNEQVLTDSLYGCKTMHGLFQYTQDASNVDDGVSGGEGETMNENLNDVKDGEIVCGEICIPISIYEKVMKKEKSTVSLLEYGSCSQNGYQCNYASDAFDLGLTEIEQDLYKQGECR